ncbi:MAG: UDP-N-acetylmuramyl-tripeptide synthetase [Bacillota bacterium]|nr:UDP-N-acetylmuramyl-tripeptide synthetase [Bacillota bacterium]
MKKIKVQDKLTLTGITSDSREVKPGYAFIAISGFKEDGNKYIGDAVKRGAAIIYTDKQIVEADWDVPVVFVKNARKELAKLADRFYQSPSKKINLIGVTGTNGKTTTTYIIHSILNNCNNPAGLLGTIDYKIGNESITSKLTTPHSTFIQQFLNQLVATNNKAAVMEVSSHGVKLNRVAQLDFDIGIYTNLAPDHYDLHPDFADYLNTKKSWFDSLKESACLIYNKDDTFASEMVGSSPAATKISYGFGENCVVRGDNRKINEKGLSLEITITEPFSGIAGKIGRFNLEPQSITINTAMLGKHNCYNVMAAVTACLVHGIPLSKIQASLQKFPGVWRRMQLIQQEPFFVIDDATHNPQNYEAVFEATRELPYNKMWVVVGIRGNRGWQINYENAIVIGKYYQELKFNLAVTKSLDTNGPLDEVFPEEEQAFTRALWEHKVSFDLYDELFESLREVLGKVQKNDLVLLLGGHPFDNVNQMVEPFINNRIEQLVPDSLVNTEEKALRC